MRQVVFYQTQAGHCPIEDFLDSLSAQEARRVTWVLRLLKELERVPTQYFKKLPGTEELWEIRVRAGGNSIRLLGFFRGATRLVLCHGFLKKRQKISRNDIVLAEQRKQDYIKRSRI